MPASFNWRYGFYGLPLAMAALPIYVYVPKFYSSLGLPLASLGYALLILRFADAFIDPYLGSWSDRLHSRKTALLLASCLMCLGLPMLLNPISERAFLWGWLILSLIIVTLGFSLGSIAHNAWGAQITTDPKAQTTLTATREGLGLLGVLIASAIPSLSGISLAIGLSHLAIVQAALLVIAYVLLLGLPEPPKPKHQETFSPWRLVLKDRAFLSLLTVFALNGIASAIPATLLLFYIDDVLGASNWEAYFLLTYFIAGALGLPLWVKLADRIGLLRAWLCGMLLAIAAFSFAYFLQAGDHIHFLVVCLASGAALGADLALPPALLAKHLDARNQSQHSGAYFGVWTLVNKANLGLAAGLALPLLAVLAYTPGIKSSNLSALSSLYALLPCCLKLIAVYLLWRLIRASSTHHAPTTSL